MAARQAIVQVVDEGMDDKKISPLSGAWLSFAFGGLVFSAVFGADRNSCEVGFDRAATSWLSILFPLYPRATPAFASLAWLSQRDWSRHLKLIERAVINVCWWLWIPLFATLYRVNNYWNLPRLWKLFPKKKDRLTLATNVIAYAALYTTLCAALVWFGGWQAVFRGFGLSLFVTLSLQDLLILSQHTHIPMTLSKGGKVDPYTPHQTG